MPLQNLPDVYIDANLLQTLLTKLFGQDQYRIQFKANQWTLNVPRPLTDAEIESVEQPGQH
ncbi:hypothetical protein VTL71DRAFT_8102 [Oculimacula yallundae]|uniref:Uncharacterized protein n=1 Tax=Oculimacula yallundae TaxID=86028 RepID=A0ABR4CWM5_9HELO